VKLAFELGQWDVARAELAELWAGVDEATDQLLAVEQASAQPALGKGRRQ